VGVGGRHAVDEAATGGAQIEGGNSLLGQAEAVLQQAGRARQRHFARSTVQTMIRSSCRALDAGVGEGTAGGLEGHGAGVLFLGGDVACLLMPVREVIQASLVSRKRDRSSLLSTRSGT